VEDAEHEAARLREPDQLVRFGRRHRERLLDNDMLAGEQRVAGEGEVIGARRQDDDDVDPGVRAQLLRVAHDLDLRPVFLRALRPALDDLRKPESRNGRDDRRVERPAGIPVTDQTDIQGFLHRLFPLR